MPFLTTGKRAQRDTVLTVEVTCVPSYGTKRFALDLGGIVAFVCQQHVALLSFLCLRFIRVKFKLSCLVLCRFINL